MPLHCTSQFANIVYVETLAQTNAINCIRSLSQFYAIKTRNIHHVQGSESEDTEESIDSDISVNHYMRDLLMVWGMSWKKICKVGEKMLQRQTLNLELTSNLKRARKESSRKKRGKLQGSTTRSQSD